MEKVQFKRCRWCVNGDLTWVIILAWGQVNRIGVEGNYVCCLVMVVIFMRLAGAKSRGFKVIVWREAEGGKSQNQREGDTFYGELTPQVFY